MHTSDHEQPAGTSSSLPEPEGGAFFAPATQISEAHVQRGRRVGEDDEVAGGTKKPGSYHLKHRSQTDYPQAYEPVSTVFWKGLSQQQVDAVMRLQAVAMEKAGYEKHTPKYFIEDSVQGSVYQGGGLAAAGAGQVSVTRYVLGGMLLGMGILSLGLGLAGMLSPMLVVSAAGAVAVLTGVVLIVSPRG